MRLLSLLMVSLLAATASADPAPLSFEVVRLMPETQQVLVYDRGHNTHVLLAPGTTFDDYVVVEITGVGLTVQKQQERFTVHPKAAKGLALDLEPRKNAPPAIYSKTNPTPAPQVAAAPAPAPEAPVAATTPPKADSTKIAVNDAKRVATNLSTMLTGTPSRATGSAAAKLKP